MAGVRGWGGNGFGKAYDPARAFGHNSSLLSASYPDPVAPGLPFLDGSGTARGNHPGSEPRGHALRYTGETFNAIEWFLTPTYNNKYVAAWDETGIDGSVFDRGTPNFNIQAGSLLANAASWTNLPALNANPKSTWFNNFQQVAYAGAFGTSGNWTAGWANFSSNTDYGFTR